MKTEASKGYVAYALTACGYNDNMKITVIGKFGLLLKEAYPYKLRKYAKRHADITKSAVKTLSRVALTRCGVSESDILHFTYVLDEQMKLHTKKAASLYFIKDRYISYEPECCMDEDEDEAYPIFEDSDDDFFDADDIDLEDADEDEFETLD